MRVASTQATQLPKDMTEGLAEIDQLGLATPRRNALSTGSSLGNLCDGGDSVERDMTLAR